MLGERSGQRGLWEADQLYLDMVGRETFYGVLAVLRGRLFCDADFAELYCLDNGRSSVPPSLLATALLLQTYDQASDAEAKAKADFDIRWKVALGIEIEERPFAKSTLQLFRAQLILHDRVRGVFEQSLRLARETGYLQQRGMRVALDTTYILGRGAVKDTYNLLADGIVQLMRSLAAVADVPLRQWAEAHGAQRYVGSSVKGEAVIDWSDRQARQAWLGEIVADADQLLAWARQAQDRLPVDSGARTMIVEAAELLGQLLLQDVRRGADGDQDAGEVTLKEGVSKDRTVSVHDPEMRHGHKSSHRRFDGHKAAVVVDTASQLITAVDVLPGNAGDSRGALQLGRAERSQRGRAGGGSHGRCRLRRRRHPPGLRRRGTQTGGPGAGAAPAHTLPQGGLCHRPGTGHLYLSGRRSDTTQGAHGHPHRPHGPHLQDNRVSVRGRGVRRLPSTAAVRSRPTRHRAHCAPASPGGPLATGPGVAAQPRLCRVSPTPGDGGAQTGPPDTTGDATGPLLRSGQDEMPVVSGRHGGQSHPGDPPHGAHRRSG